MVRRYARVAVLSAVVAIVGIAATSANADSSVVGLWHFDEGSGVVAHDSSGLGHDGTLSGGVSWVPGVGVSGSALSFDGVTGSVDVADSTSLEPGQITVQAWVKRSGSPGDFRYIVDKGYSGCIAGSYGLYSGANGGVVFYVSTPSSNPSSGNPVYMVSPDPGASAVWDGNWHLVTGTYDGSAVRLYLDGAQIGSGTPWTSPIGYGLSNNDLFFGSYLGCQGLDYPGVADEIEIWNRALSPSEIQAEFHYPELVLSPASATITYGAAQTYTATALDAHNSNPTDVTSATTFTIAPDGSCSGASCAAGAVGAHTVTGNDGGVTGTATLNVTPAPLTVTANNVTRPYGAANPALGATITGFVNGQTLATSGVTGSPSCTTTATATSPPGTYPITCTQGTLAATNYSFPAANFAPGTLTVAKAATSLALPPLGVVNSVLAVIPTLKATLTSKATGAPIAGQRVSFTFSDAPKETACTGTTNSSGVASCNAGLLSITTVLLSSSYTASYAGNSNYSATSTTAPIVLLAAGKSNLRKLTGSPRTHRAHHKGKTKKKTRHHKR